MGSLTLPSSGAVYLDANCVIYSVERIEPYCGALKPLWAAASKGQITVASSQLTLLETLVKPLREKDAVVERSLRELLLESKEMRLLPITLQVIESAARLRAETRLATADAIHAATAIAHDCALFVTNDPAFRRVPGLSLAFLSQIVAPEEKTD